MRSRVRWFAAAALVLVASAKVEAQAGRATTAEGNRLYEEGRFSDAHNKYLEALLEAPDSPIINFNDGNALYRGENYEAALSAFREALEQRTYPDLLADTWYNTGNTLYRQGALPESLEAFKQALRTDPTHAGAKHNLEHVLLQMQEQEQQDQEQQSEDQSEDDQEYEEDDQSGEGQQSEGEQPPQDNQEPEEDDQSQEDGNEGGDPQNDQNESEQQQSQPESGNGQMTREEAERLLQAIQEDPDEVDRQHRAVRGSRPRRDW